MTAHRKPAVVTYVSSQRCRVDGVLYRAVDSAYRTSALAGSRLPGRYSAAGQSTLYLSSSPEGVTAAMAAHGDARSDLTLLAFDVHAEDIVDLRVPAALTAARVAIEDAVAPWQDVVAAGGVPRSWGVRQRLEDLGAQGLIDPSRTRPGLWHLVLFRWNTEGAARVAPLSKRIPESRLPESTILGHVSDQAAQRFAQALEMHEVGRQMYRMRMRREHPAWSPAEIDDAVTRWLEADPLVPGRPGSDERWLRLAGHPSPRRS